ncbi:MAG: thiamine phosphate synthase [Muribaculaceae bacterium]
MNMLQFITNADNASDIVGQVKDVIAGGCRWVQLRMKNASKEEIMPVAEQLKKICTDSECILIIDDHVDIAKELALDGVHLGKTDMNPAEARAILGANPIIGVTANTFADIEAYSSLDVDYVGLGPFRYTTTKKNLSPILGIDGYKAIMQQCAENGIYLPVVAIGGIGYADIQAVMNTGVHGVAVSGSLINAESTVEATRAMIDLLSTIVERRKNI